MKRTLDCEGTGIRGPSIKVPVASQASRYKKSECSSSRIKRTVIEESSAAKVVGNRHSRLGKTQHLRT